MAGSSIPRLCADRMVAFIAIVVVTSGWLVSAPTELEGGVEFDRVGRLVSNERAKPVDGEGRPVIDDASNRMEYDGVVFVNPRDFETGSSIGDDGGVAGDTVTQVILEWTRGTFGTGIGAMGLHVVDLDGNGANDIVATASAAGFGANSFWYVLHRTTSGYEQSWISAPYSAPITSLIVGDADGDSDPDVMIGYGNKIEKRDGQTLSVIGTITTTASTIRGLTMADVDSDGNLEFLFCDSSKFFEYDVISGQLEYSNASFAGYDVAVGQVDQDSTLEIVVSGNSGGYTGYVLDGVTHAVEWTYPMGFGSYVRAGDIDDDGMDEIVAGESWYRITIHDADLQSPKYEIPTDLDVDAVRLFDVENDGSLEIVYGDGQWGAVYVHDGASGALKWQVSNPEHGVTDVSVGDTDGDGVNELLWGAGFSSSGPDYLYVADCESHEREWQSQDVSGPFYGFDYGDVDDDGAVEFLYSSFESDSGYGDGLWFVHDGATKQLEYSSGETTGVNWTGLWRIRHANIDADDQAEIFITSSSTYDGKLICYDGITHSEQFRSSLPSGLTFRSLVLADVDSDGQIEAVGAPYREHTGAPGTYLYVFNTVNGAEEWHSVQLGSYWASLTYLRVGNVDADPQMEMVVGEAGGALWVYDGVTHVQEAGTVDLDLTALELADRNGDGIMEIIAGSSNGALRVIHPDTGAIVETVYQYSGQIDGLAVRDVTFDGTADYIFALNNKIKIQDGSAPESTIWSSETLGTGVGAFDSLTVGDVDGDGLTEIAVNIGVNGLQIFEIQTPFDDCNVNGIPDEDDLAGGASSDCQSNSIPDECDPDVDTDGFPDDCDQFGDFDHDTDRDLEDFGILTVCFSLSGPGESPPFSECLATFDEQDSHTVDMLDVAAFQRVFEP